MRLRIHDEIARIEIDEEAVPAFIENRKKIIEFLKKLGFRYITLDLEGFRSGSIDIGVRFLIFSPPAAKRNRAWPPEQLQFITVFVVFRSFPV
ncbi:hypothetical protein [Faecalicatena contorta]|uniref:hypothetical protein n=1 Tax=Faecalicatena contorta TaxID=39482 RepID=UPI000D6CDCC3|nr:hypothetical protein [Faecalicatena contorta]